MSKHRTRIALTFDVEPPEQAEVTQHELFDGSAILDELAKRNIKATFFLQGAWVQAYPELAQRIVNEGHSIGNHTQAHIRLSDTAPKDCVSDITEAHHVIEAATGKSPKPYFRCPQNAGGWDEGIQNLLESQGYKHIHWNVDSFDWHENASTEHAIESIKRGLLSFEPTVVLFHSWTNLANEHLGEILDALSGDTLVGNSLEYVTLDELEAAHAHIEPMVYTPQLEPGGLGLGEGRLGKSIAWGTIARGVSVISNFIFSILLARALGPIGKGEYAFIQQFIGILAIVLNLGLPTSNVYYVAKKKVSAQTAFANSVVLLLPTTLLSAAITFVFLLSPFRGQVDYSTPLFVASVLLFATTTLFGWINAVLIGKHGLKPQGVATIAQSAILIIGAAAMLIFGRIGVVSMLYLATIAQAGGVLVLWLYDSSIASIVSFDWCDFKSMMHYSLKAYVIDVANFLHLRQDILILGWLCTPSQVGLYSVAVSFVEIVRYMPVIIGSAFFAEVSSLDIHEQDAKTAVLSRLNVLLNIVLVIGFFVLLPYALPLLFGEQFKPAVIIAFLLLPGALFTSVAEIPGTLLFARETIYWRLSSIMVIVNIVANIVVVPHFGGEGAALASTLTYSCYSAAIMVMTLSKTGLSLKALVVPRKSDFELIVYKARQLSRRVLPHN